MYKTMVLAAVLATAFAACGGGGPASTPEDTFKNLQDTVESEDWVGLMDYMPPSQREKAEKEFKKGLEDPMGLSMMASMMGIKPEELKEMDFRTAMGKLFETQMGMNPEEKDKMVNATIKETKIDGDRATITIEQDGKTDQVTLVKEDGAWYMKDMGN